MSALPAAAAAAALALAAGEKANQSMRDGSTGTGDIRLAGTFDMRVPVSHGVSYPGEWERPEQPEGSARQAETAR
ncbi:MAG TPA: hypothetical protein VLW50_11340 [Streptosporangiaceae bacterium]|nr:hypothetical protein [Streptosporangiaceae bacterium]